MKDDILILLIITGLLFLWVVVLIFKLNNTKDTKNSIIANLQKENQEYLNRILQLSTPRFKYKAGNYVSLFTDIIMKRSGNAGMKYFIMEKNNLIEVYLDDDKILQ